MNRATSYKYLNNHLTNVLKWILHIQQILQKSDIDMPQLQQKFKVSTIIWRIFYSSAAEIILTGSITYWHRECTAQYWRALQRLVCSAECTISAHRASPQDFYTRRMRLSPKNCSGQLPPKQWTDQAAEVRQMCYQSPGQYRRAKMSFYPHAK